jgi:hypothetical protein
VDEVRLVPIPERVPGVLAVVPFLHSPAAACAAAFFYGRACALWRTLSRQNTWADRGPAIKKATHPRSGR